MTALVRRIVLLAGLGALAALATTPRVAAQAGPGASAPGPTAPKGSATPFPGGAAPAGAPKTAAPALAGPVAPARVATINWQDAMTGTQEGKREFDALKKKFEPQEAALKGMNDEIDKMKADLSSAQSLSADDRAKRQKVIEQKTTDLQGRFDTAQRSYQQAEQDVLKRLGPKMITATRRELRSVQGIRHEEVVDIGNPQTPVVWAGDRLNITKGVVEAYDKANPLK